MKIHIFELRKKKYIFIYSLSSHLLNEYISSIGRALHRYHRDHGFASRSSLNFFQASFRNCLSCVYNCDDHSIIHSSSTPDLLLLLLLLLLELHIRAPETVPNAPMTTGMTKTDWQFQIYYYYYYYYYYY